MDPVSNANGARATWSERELMTPEPRPARRIHTELAPQASAHAVARLSNRPSESVMAKRLDDFLRAMEPEYRVNGKTVRVAAGFRSRYGESPAELNEAFAAVRKEIGKEKLAEIALQVRRAQSSRGTPEDVRVATQALIDAGAAAKVLAKNPKLDERQAIRVVMQTFRIGCDCRGYVYRAFLHARGTGSLPARASAHFDKDEGHVIFSDERRLRTVELPAARTGDILRLKPDGTGRDHNVIVRSNRVESAPAGKITANGRKVPAEFLTAGWPSGSTPRVRVLTVDSSWGGGGDPLLGGTKREVWLQNEITGRWAYWDAGGTFRTATHPYAHEILGIFRPRSES